MSGITEIITSLKRSNLSLEESSNEVTQILNSSKKGLDNLNRPLEELIGLEKKQNEEISKYESNNLSLSKEFSTLRNEKTTKESLLSSTQENYNNSTEKRAKLEAIIRDSNSELSDFTNNLESAESELLTITKEKEGLQIEIEQLVANYDKQLNEINKQSEQKRDYLRKVKGERMALEYLIKKNFVEFNEMKIINSLEGRKKTDLSTISKVTGISENLIIKTLEGLQKRNVLQFNSSSGEIIVTNSLRI